MMSKEIVWLSGSSGFIGQALTKRLEAEGKIVYPIDRHLNLPNVKPDYVYYLASYGNYHDQTDKDEILKVNAGNVDRLLFSLQNNPPKLFMYFSSSSVYGNHPHKLGEDTELEGQTDYAKAKITGETICYHYKDNLPIVVVRPFSVTGVGEQEKHLIPTAIKAAFTGETLNLDPLPVHDFVDVFDLINAVYLLTKVKKQIKGISTYNICLGKQYSNQEVIDLIEKISGKKINVKLIDNLRSYDTTNWLGDPSLLVWLGWRRRHTLEDSLRDMINYYHESENKDI